jgi:hypothetical protein
MKEQTIIYILITLTVLAIIGIPGAIRELKASRNTSKTGIPSIKGLTCTKHQITYNGHLRRLAGVHRNPYQNGCDGEFHQKVVF